MKTKNSKENVIKDYEKIINYVLKSMGLSYRRDELFDVGMIGFVNGINSYDETKGFTYMTYLYDCIKNEILHYLKYENRKRRIVETISLNTEINYNTELLDFIPSYEKYDEILYLDELLYVINRRLSFLSERDETIFKHLYGIDGYKELTTEELQEKFKTSKQNIQRIKMKILRMLRYEMLSKYYKTYQELLKTKNNSV